MENTKILAAAALTLIVAATPAVAAASETATYNYDALGRLIGVGTVGGPNDGMSVGTGYDPAGNRASYSVTGAGPAGLAAASASGPALGSAEAAEGSASEQPAPEATVREVSPQEEQPVAAVVPDAEAAAGNMPGGAR
jgi:hypothetical protein